MKKFWKKTEGFTLVELIVVIAILGILAGVGTVGYSGYIKKANMAADQVLLDSLNTAFAAACIENGVANTAVTASDIDLSDKTVDEADIVLTHAKAADIKEDLMGYYEGGQFKVMTALKFEDGMFKDAGAGGNANAGGIYASLMQALKVSHADKIADLKDSTYGAMGMNGLMTQLNDVTGIAADMVEAGMSGMGNMGVQTVLAGDDFKESAANALGIGLSDLDGKLNELAAEMMSKNPGMTQDEAIAQVQANAAVLYTAKQTAGMSTDDATALFTSASSGRILDKMLRGDGEGFAEAALVCGMYTAYVNREGSTVADKTVDVEHVLSALNNDTGFQNYLSDPQGQKDLAGYLGALEILSSSTGGDNTDEVESLMVNGFNDSDLIAGLNGLLDR